MSTRHSGIRTFLALVLSLVGMRAVAEQSAAAQGVPVNMVVSVEPKHGNNVPTITQSDVMVYQGHDRHPVTNWVPANGNRAGLALAILIDDAAGLSLGSQLNDIRTSIGQQAPTTPIAVGYMRDGTVALAQNFTQDHTAAAKSLRLAEGFSARHTSVGDTAMQDPNWAELMKSMQTMHAAMAAAQPSGNDDVDFVRLMLPHHQAAVDMAKTELLHGTDPQMRRLAQEIITDQQSEIQLMQLWLDHQRAGLREPNQQPAASARKEK